MNFEASKTKSGLKRIAILSLVEKVGGEMAMIDQINESYKIGKLTKKQAFDLRKSTKEACKLKEGITMESDVIKELNNKVEETCKNYRR